jgi:two-component system, cell cycle response regulator
MEKILIVDDDRFFLELCSDVLRGEGYDVQTATSGERALQLLAQDAYRLVVSDLFMPGMSGLDFLSRVKTKDPAIDVIMVTGNANIESAVFALKNGARDYLVKPVNLDEFKHTVALCLEQRRLLDENFELKDLVNVYQVGQAISNCIDLERLYPLVTDSLANELRLERALGIFHDEAKGFHLKEVRGIPAEMAEALASAIIRRYGNDPASSADHPHHAIAHDRLRGPKELDLADTLILSIRTRNGLQGIVALFNNPGRRLPPGLGDTRFNFLLDQASLAFENALRYSNLSNLIYIDELTGLFNYRYLDIALDRETKRVERYGSSVSVIFLDLDLFKGVNDNHGHLVGSEVLREVGTLLKKSVRDVDVIVRYGGDEYTVILSEIGEREAAMVAERIRRTIEEHSFVAHEGYDIHLTASIGYACFPEDTRSKKELLDLADQAMYRGKESGKNRVFRALQEKP